MHGLNRLVRLTIMIAAIVTTVAVTGAASASPATPSRSPTATTAASTGARIIPNLTPKGCNSNQFCSYNQSNGGHLCFQTSKNMNTWPSACANHNDSAYNRNGNSVNLYYEIGFAYYTLYSGNYLLYMNQNTFNHCSSGTDGCGGLHQEMQNNVDANRFN